MWCLRGLRRIVIGVGLARAYGMEGATHMAGHVPNERVSAPTCEGGGICVGFQTSPSGKVKKRNSVLGGGIGWTVKKKRITRSYPEKSWYTGHAGFTA